MVLNGLFAATVRIGIIGVVLFLYLRVIQSCHFHFCAHFIPVGSNKVERDDRDNRDTGLARHRPRHSFIFFSTKMPREKTTKKLKQVAVKRKEVHKIKWNPNSAHKGENIQQWSEEDMVKAMDMYKTGNYSQRAISRATGIHVATLNKRFRGLVKGTGHRLGGAHDSKVFKQGTNFKARHQARHFVSRLRVSVTCLGFQTHSSRSLESIRFIYFSFIEEEKDLHDTVMMFARRGFPFTGLKLRKLAWQLARANKRKGFSPDKQMAGKWWLDGFLKRWKSLRKKNAKNLSLHRAQCANAYQVAKFFKLYRTLLNKYDLNYKPFNIWNIDESGIPDMPKEQQVIGVTGEPTSQTVSGEKPQNTTVMTYCCAGGLFMPPMVIFKGAKLDPDWYEAAPTGYSIRTSPTGYINSKIFAAYGEKFIQFLKDKKLYNKGKHLLLLDSHSSHSFNLHFMRYMKGHGVEVLCFPPHCTHLMQPLDDTPFANLKKAYQRHIVDYNFKTSARKMNKVDFFRVLVPAYTEAVTEKTVKSGFENTGIYPVNPKAKKLLKTWPSLISDKFSKLV